MSRRKSSRSLLTILKELGVPIDKKAEALVKHEKEVDPEASTDDIVMRLSLAPPALVEQAIEIAKSEGSTDLLADRFTQAKTQVQEVRRASLALSDAACAAVAAKKY